MESARHCMFGPFSSSGVRSRRLDGMPQARSRVSDCCAAVAVGLETNKVQGKALARLGAPCGKRRQKR
jgi:hypothetical protein